MDDPSLARALVDAVISDFPDHKPGTRPIHTIGIGAQGYFEASDVARSYCIAEHFARQRIPVSVRFSNGSGSPVQHDGWNDVRGMATRFHLADGAATDLIAMTLGELLRSDRPKPRPNSAPILWSPELLESSGIA